MRRSQRGSDVNWQPIETAPKDCDVLLFCPRTGVVRGRWQPDDYAKKPIPYWTHDRERTRGVKLTRADQPTHWAPLKGPEPLDVLLKRAWEDGKKYGMQKSFDEFMRS